MIETPIPFIVEIARERQQAYIRAAEQWGRQHVEQERTTQHRAVRSAVAQTLIRFRQWLVESGEPATPAKEAW